MVFGVCIFTALIAAFAGGINSGVARESSGDLDGDWNTANRNNRRQITLSRKSERSINGYDHSEDAGKSDCLAANYAGFFKCELIFHDFLFLVTGVLSATIYTDTMLNCCVQDKSSKKILLASQLLRVEFAPMTKNTTATNTKTKHMWTPPDSWHKAATDARDAEAMYQALMADNARREARGLPTFEPSYELAIAAIRA